MNLLVVSYPDSPSVASMSCWSIFEVDDDDGSRVRLLFGWIKPTRLRVTSQIERIEGGEVLTRSGSIYRLEGPPASLEQLEEQKTRRQELLGGRAALDVTRLYA